MLNSKYAFKRWALGPSALVGKIKLACFFTCCLLHATSLAFGGDVRTFSQKRIAQIEYYVSNGQQALTAQTPEHLNIRGNPTVVHPGDTLSRHKIQQSLKALYATQQYSHIRVHGQETPTGGLVLTYTLTPFARIKHIEIIGIPENIDPNTLRAVLHSKQGGTYIPTRVKTDAHRLKNLCRAHGYFDARVSVPQTLPETGTLTYDITSGPPASIKTLQFHGNTALATHRLRAVCTFSTGRSPIYNTSAVETDIAAMRDLYRKNNYPTATFIPTFQHQTGILQFDVTEGKQVEIQFVSHTGERILPHQSPFRKEIRALINTTLPSLWEREIKAYFNAKAYHETTLHQDTRDPERIHLTIYSGTRYVVKAVTFSGNRAFSDAKLIQEITTKPRTGWIRTLYATLARTFRPREHTRFFSQTDLERDIHRLKILYANAGYPQTDIRPHLDTQYTSTPHLGDIRIHLTIREPYKQMIHHCNIIGNTALETYTLLTRIQQEYPFPQPNARLLHKVYRDALLKAYYQRGYLDATVTSTYLSETPVFKVTGNFTETLSKGKLPPELHAHFNRHAFSLTDVHIATQHQQNQFSLQDSHNNLRYTLKQHPTHLEVYAHGLLNITIPHEGEQAVFGNFYFQGDTHIVKPHILHREVQHLPGTLFTAEKLSTARQNLYTLGLFHTIQDERLPHSEDVPNEGENRTLPDQKINDVLITLQKQKPRTFGISTGYTLDEGLRATCVLTHSNLLFKRNLRARIRTRAGWRDSFGYLLDATLTHPWLLHRTRATAQLLAKKLESDANVQALQASLLLNRNFSQTHILHLKYAYRHLTPPPHLHIHTDTTTVSSLRLAYTYDTRNRYLNPTRGIYTHLTLEYAGGPLYGKTSFLKTTTETRYYHPLTHTLVLATALRLGLTTGLRSNRHAELINFERFHAGGATTLRGYKDRSLGPKDATGTHRGDVQLILNTELRFPIYRPLRGALFCDTGNIWRSLLDIHTTDPIPTSIGAGLYLDLAPLTLGIDYAHPLLKTHSALNPHNAFHIRLASTF